MAATIVAVVGLDVLWWRTGLLRRPAYLVTTAIVFAFQIGVDGWLTKLSAPVVLYGPRLRGPVGQIRHTAAPRSVRPRPTTSSKPGWPACRTESG